MARRASSVTSTSSGRSAGALELAAQQVVAGDGHLLVLGVAVEPDDLHPVEQRAGDGLGHVGRGEEQHLRQVELHLEVVVAEGVVLGRVEDLEQGRGRVAAVVGAELVDLVQHDDRVHGPRLAQRPDQPAGLGADVGAAVAADLGLVAHAAQGDPHELASEGAGHRLAQRGLAHAGGADQGQDGARRRADPRERGRARPGACARPGARGCAPSRRSGPSWSSSRIRAASATSRLSSDCDAPGQLEDGVEPGPDPPVLGVLLARALQLVDLALDRRAHGLGQVASLDLRPVVVGVPSSVVPSSSLSSLRMASSWRRSRNSRWVFSMPSSTLVLICSRRVRSARVSRAQPMTRRRRASTSTVSSTSTFWARVRSGRVPGQVGHLRGVGHVAQTLGHPAGAAGEEDVLEHGPVLTGQLGGLGCAGTFGDRFHLDPQGVARSRARRCRWWPARGRARPRPGARRAAHRLP